MATPREGLAGRAISIRIHRDAAESVARNSPTAAAGWIVRQKSTLSPIPSTPVVAAAAARMALAGRVLRVTEDDDDGAIRLDDDRVMRTAPLGVVSGAVVGVLTALPSG
jgi:hypothetical protein